MIFIAETIHPEALERLRAETRVDYRPDAHSDRDGLKRALAAAKALIVRNQTIVDAELLEAAPGLMVVGRLGVGLDNLELPALRAKGITVTWAPGTNAVSVAEYVLGVMLTFARRYGDISADLHRGRWDRGAAVGTELYGKTLGIIGLGDIGGRLARRAEVFGLRLLATDPAVHDSLLAVQEFGVTLVDLKTLLAESDFVSLHAPLLPSTQHLINEAALAGMKATAYLINTARGGLVDEHALARALMGRRLAGAALDVRQQEPPGPEDPLQGIANLILTPHIAGVTGASNRRASLRVAEDVLLALAGKRPVSPLKL